MRRDPHSYADLAQGRTTHLTFHWTVDFEARVLRGSTRLELDEARDGPLDLDTRGLQIEAVVDEDGEPLAFDLSEPDPVLGARLPIQRDRQVGTLEIRYQSSPEATALMWLEPAQTAGGSRPFVLTQCQAIHARSITPVQDTPRVRASYRAEVTIPENMSAVMSAAPGEETPGADAGGRTLSFEMPQPIPSYLLALAVGELDHRDIGPRTRVYAEPSVVEAAAWEFADAEKMLEAAEKLFGPYAWDRYDFIVLPPSFPMGGMENPRMTFLTPTLIAGDRSLVSVLAHELAHSWTGNLVTNATNEDFWLNEGWTVYAERRLLEALYGVEDATQQARLGRMTLEETFEERRGAGQSTALHYDQDGLDPDREFSKIPYEKGFLLLVALERAVGREAFDGFIQGYIDRFRFRSIDTATFVDFVRAELPEAKDVDLESWIGGEGLVAEAPRFASKRLEELSALAEAWTPDDRPPADGWTTTETLFFLAELPRLDAAATEALGEWLGLRETRNAELQCAWLVKAASARVDGVEDELRAFVDRVGRTKLIKPVLAAMIDAGMKELAEELIASNRPRWHSSTRLVVDGLVAAAA